VAEAVSDARRAVDRLYGHRVMRRRADEVTAESVLRGARASAALEGADWPLEEVRRRTDYGADAEARRVGGALRVTAESGQLLSAWRHSPLQVLARLHLLATGDAEAGAGASSDPGFRSGSGAGSAVGRPRLAGEAIEELLPLDLPAADSLGPDGLPEVPDFPLPAAPSADEAAARLDALARLLVDRVARKAPATAAPALEATTSNPSGAAVTASP
jgi:hypothetical protein